MQKSTSKPAVPYGGSNLSAMRRLMLLGASAVVTSGLFVNACGVEIGFDRFGNLTLGLQDEEDRNFFDELGDGLSSLFDDDDGDNFLDDIF